jgi:cytochrome c2
MKNPRMTTMIVGAIAAMTLSSVLRAAEIATEVDAMAGRAYAVRDCSECHVVSPEQKAPLSPPLKNAPSFQSVANARTTSAIGLHVFLVSPHPTMPNLIIAEQDRVDVIAYIMSLREPI